MSASPYPVHVGAELDPGLTRSLWLVEWLLAIPHFFVGWSHPVRQLRCCDAVRGRP